MFENYIQKYSNNTNKNITIYISSTSSQSTDCPSNDYSRICNTY